MKVEMCGRLLVGGFQRDHLPWYVWQREMKAIPRIGDTFGVRIETPDGTLITAEALVDRVHWPEDDEGVDVVVDGQIVTGYLQDGDRDLTLVEVADLVGVPRILEAM